MKKFQDMREMGNMGTRALNNLGKRVPLPNYHVVISKLAAEYF